MDEKIPTVIQESPRDFFRMIEEKSLGAAAAAKKKQTRAAAAEGDADMMVAKARVETPHALQMARANFLVAFQMFIAQVSKRSMS